MRAMCHQITSQVNIRLNRVARVVILMPQTTTTTILTAQVDIQQITRAMIHCHQKRRSTQLSSSLRSLKFAR